jgi:glycolate oxidase FAD binding subunit
VAWHRTPARASPPRRGRPRPGPGLSRGPATHRHPGQRCPGALPEDRGAAGAAVCGDQVADPVLAALIAACPAARPATAGDAVAGVTPRFAASPASVEEASALLRAAAQHDLAVVPRGSGSKLGWGAPPRRCDLVVDTLRLDQVLEHAAGDLVVRVQAGVGLGRLAEVLAGAGQRLSLDPSPTGGTAGGTLATGTAGPLRLRYGTPRDLVLGVTVVRADGTVAHAGGKVVKNVAGYDLGKLFSGSFGTLGLIVEAVFRLHPQPAAAAYITLDCDGAEQAQRAVASAAASILAPSAIEIDRPARGRPVSVAVLVDGDQAGVAERAKLMSELLGATADISQDGPQWWGWRRGAPATVPANSREDAGGPRDADRTGDVAGADGARGAGSAASSRDATVPGGAAGADGADGAGESPRRAEAAGPAGPDEPGTLIRVAFWSAALRRVIGAIDGAARDAGVDPAVGGSAAAGVIYAALGPDAPPDAAAAFVSGLRAALARGDGDARPAAAAPPDSPPVLASAVVVHAPPAVASQVDLWGPVPSLPLMRAIKDQFDPGHRMAPGRFVGGI